VSIADPPPSVPGVAPSGLYDARDPTPPDSDGEPMADGTRRFDWIVTIKEGFEALKAEEWAEAERVRGERLAAILRGLGLAPG
jgi:hypothetical protein